MPEKKFHILVAPLDWGIGHATRCVPIIRMLLQKGAQVTVTTSGEALAFLRLTFPEVECIRSEGFRVIYPEKGSMVMKMALSSPGFLIEIYRENRWLQQFIKEYGIDAVISDNRFGFWSRSVPCIYLTHQVMIKAPSGMKALEPYLYRAHNFFIRKYDECWIPDVPGEENLSGDLSHKYVLPLNAHFIGPLTRFVDFVQLPVKEDRRDANDLLILLSGPEPQRSVLEKTLRKEVKKRPDLKVAMLQGKPGRTGLQEEQHELKVYSHLPDYRIAGLISNAGRIICRPGYSTVMDLSSLKKTALLVPTPGQTEQEYLGRYLAGKGWFTCIPQHKISLEKIMASFDHQVTPMPDFQAGMLLEERIDQLFNRITEKKSGVKAGH